MFTEVRHTEIAAFSHPNAAMTEFLNSIKASGECLLAHLKEHPNRLTQLRFFNFFCIFHLLRYFSLLEAFYCDEKPRAILLDFSGDSQSSIARASVMSYTQMHRAISRFYAWGYAQQLSVYSREELLCAVTPMYEAPKKAKDEKKKKKKTASTELDEMWDMAKEDARKATSDDEARLIFGTTIYDMLALEASSHPVNYVRSLGALSGILYPPTNFHVNKRFVLSQDVLEMIIRSCVLPSETISAMGLRERLINRFGIIIGGNESEFKRLEESGSILQVDSDALNNNFERFAETLEAMDFAEIMADGILQIRLGGVTQ